MLPSAFPSWKTYFISSTAIAELKESQNVSKSEIWLDGVFANFTLDAVFVNFTVDGVFTNFTLDGVLAIMQHILSKNTFFLPNTKIISPEKESRVAFHSPPSPPVFWTRFLAC